MGSKKRIKKGEEPAAVGRIHKDKQLPYNLLRFSFRHYYTTEKFCPECIPDKDGTAYLAKFLDRLKDVSSFTVDEFRANRNGGLRAHIHDWVDTTERAGFSRLSEQLKGCEPWQFCLSVNEYGRVHGLLVDDVFYVVWIDPKHNLYPNNHA